LQSLLARATVRELDQREAMRTRLLVTLVLIAVFALIFASTSQAARPFHFQDTSSEFDPHFATCNGQDISLFTTGRTHGTTFFDSDGDVVRTIVHNRFLDHFTNTITGEKLLNRGTFQETFIPVPGTDEFTDTVVGHVFLATQPGHGIVIHDSGRVVFSPNEEEILFAAGHHDELVEHQFEALLCSALT
jgi:hypothetical protein